jgi:hypothetical protein
MVKQKVSPGNIDEIGEFGVTTVWGRTVGDRVIADVLLYYLLDPAALYQAIEEKEARKP